MRKETFDLEDMEELKKIPSLNLPDIIERKCYKPKDGSPYMLFFCEEKTSASRNCIYCGSPDIYIHAQSTQPRFVHDVNVGITQIDLVLFTKRYRCNKCGNTFNRRFDSILENRQMTQRLYEQIKRESFVQTFSELSHKYGYSDTTIANIFDEYAAELEKQRGPIIAPRVLGIDEKHIVHALRAVFIDIETGVLLEMKPNNKKKDIIETIENMIDYDKNIELVTMDMHNGYRSHVQECLPNAKIVVDKYHIYQDLNRKIATTKTKLLDYLFEQVESSPSKESVAPYIEILKEVKSNVYLFKFGEKKLTENQNRIDIIAKACEMFPELNHMRLLKTGFERIYDCADRVSAETCYEEWKKLVPPTGSRQIKAWESEYGVKAEHFSELRVFLNATKRWKEEIFNYFDDECNVTNAAAEGFNRFIELINRQGSGYSFERLRAKSLFGHMAAPKVLYSIKEHKKFKYSDLSSGNGGFTTKFMGFGNTDYEIVLSIEEVKTPPIEQIPFSVFMFLEDDVES